MVLAANLKCTLRVSWPASCFWSALGHGVRKRRRDQSWLKIRSTRSYRQRPSPHVCQRSQALETWGPTLEMRTIVE